MPRFWDVDFRVDGTDWTVSILKPGTEAAALREGDRFCREANDGRVLLRDTIRPAPEPTFTYYGDDPLLKRR